MGVVSVLIEVAAVLIGGFLITVKFIPWVSIRVGRLLGFRLQATPITLRRIARFKRIKRGYYAFLLICTLFVISLFLELLNLRKTAFLKPLRTFPVSSTPRTPGGHDHDLPKYWHSLHASLTQSCLTISLTSRTQASSTWGFFFTIPRAFSMEPPIL